MSWPHCRKDAEGEECMLLAAHMKMILVHKHLQPLWDITAPGSWQHLQSSAQCR